MANTPILKRFLLSLLLLPGLVLLASGAVIGPVQAQTDGCTADTWDINTFYSRGSVVTHEQHEWRAKRNTEGREPGTHKPTWQDPGACESEPPPPPLPPPPPDGSSPMQIFGIWHAVNHYADRALPRNMVEFGEANHWIIGRAD